MCPRPADLLDAEAIAAIYSQGIAERIATFETCPRSPADVLKWFSGRFPVVVVEQEEKVIAFAAAFEYSPRECYSGIAEASVYVDRAHRGRGAGRMAMNALMREAARRGFWKLMLKIFEENEASRSLARALGFREVGILERHAQVDGVWRNVVLAEKLLGLVKIR